MQRTLDQRRNNNQNNTDLLLSVYELTARSSLQIGQRPRQQSQSREKYKFKQSEPKKVDLMSISSPGSQKKLPLSPQVKLQSPREPGLIFNFIRAANNAIENNTDEKLIKTYLTLRTQIEMRLDAFEQADALAVQFEKIKQENDTLRKKVTETMNSQVLTNQAQMKLQLQKLEKKAESRKVCIKKLYQLLERNEKELELYKQGKKSAKTSFTKKNELNEILNGVYPKNKENIPDSYEPVLLQLIKDIDSKNFEALEGLSKNSTNGDVETDRIILITNSLKQFKTMIDQKEEIVNFSVEICEKNQDLWKKFLEIDLTCQKQIHTLRQAISELETNIKTYYQFLKQIGHQSAQKFQEAYQFQGVIGDSIAKWLKQLGEIQEIINQRESDQYEFQQFQETLVLRLKEIMQNNKITHKENDFKGILEAINEKLVSLAEENSVAKQELNNSFYKVKQQYEEQNTKLKQEHQNCEQQIKQWKEQYDCQVQVHRDLLDKYENLQCEFNKQTQISLSALQTKQVEISNLNEQTKKLKEDITRSQEIKLTYNEQKEQIGQFKKEIERLNQIILQMQARASTQEESFTTIIDQNKSEITRLHQLIIDLHSQIEQFENQISLLKEAEQIMKEKCSKDSINHAEKIKRLQEVIQNLQVEHTALEDEYKQIQQQNIEFYSQQQHDLDMIDQLKQINAQLLEEKEEKTNEFLTLSNKQMTELQSIQEKHQKLEQERKKLEDQITTLQKDIQKHQTDIQKNLKTITDQQRQQEITSQKLNSFEKLNEQNQLIISEQKRLLNESQIQLQKINQENELLLQNNSESLQQLKNTYELQQLELNQTKQVVLDQQELIQNQQLLYQDSQQECHRYKKQIEQLEIINKSNQQELSKNIQDQNSLISQLKSKIQQLDNISQEKQNELIRLNEELEEKSIEMESLKLEISSLIEEKEQNIEKISQLQAQEYSQQQQFDAQLKEKQFEFENQENNLRQLQEEKDKIEKQKSNEIQTLKHQVAAFQKTLSEQKAGFEEIFNKQINSFEEESKSQQSEIAKLTIKLRDTTAQLEKEQNASKIERQELKETIQSLESKVQQLDQKNKEMQQQSMSNQNLYQQLIQQFEDLQKENSKESQIFKEQLHQKDEKIRFLETSHKIEIIQQSEQLKQAQQKQSELQKHIEKHQKQVEGLNLEIKALNETLKEKIQELDIIRSQIQEKNAALEANDSKFKSLTKDFIQLQTKLSLSQSQINQQCEKVQQLTNQIKLKGEENDKLKGELLVSKQNLDQLQQNFQLLQQEKQQITFLSQEKNSLLNEKNQVAQENQNLHNQILQLSILNKEQIEENQKLSKLIDEQTLEKDQFISKLNQQSNNIDALQNQNQVIVKQQAELLQQNEILQQVVSELKDERQLLSIQIQQQEQKLQEYLQIKQEYSTSQDQEIKLKEQTNNLLSSLNLKDQQIQNLKEELSDMKMQLTQEEERLQQIMNEKEQTNSTLLQKMSNQENIYGEQLREQSKKIVEITETYEQQVYNLNQQLFDVQQLLHQQQGELSEQLLKISEQQVEHSKTKNQVSELSKLIEILKDQLTYEQEKVESLQMENESIKAKETSLLKSLTLGQIEFEKISELLQSELSISEVTEENILNALSQIKNEFQDLLDKQSQSTMLIYQLYSQLSQDSDEDGIENQLQIIIHSVSRLLEIQEQYELIQQELGQTDLVGKIRELKSNNKKNTAAQNQTDFKSIEAYSQLLDGLLQEFLHNRVNLTMQSMKSLLTDQQRQNVNEYRKKIGELQNKLLQAEKYQKSMEDAKFSLQQYQQIVDKSEQKAMYFEMECKKLTQQIQELRSQAPQRISVNDIDNDMSEQTLNILNFSFRQEVLYGDNSFFGEFSQVQETDTHRVCKQQILQLMEECQILQERVYMANEDRRV